MAGAKALAALIFVGALGGPLALFHVGRFGWGALVLGIYVAWLWRCATRDAKRPRHHSTGGRW